MAKTKPKKKYRYFTEVTGQTFGSYQVKHTNKKEMERYRRALKRQYPYFIEKRSGKIVIKL